MDLKHNASAYMPWQAAGTRKYVQVGVLSTIEHRDSNGKSAQHCTRNGSCQHGSPRISCLNVHDTTSFCALAGRNDRPRGADHTAGDKMIPILETSTPPGSAPRGSPYARVRSMPDVGAKTPPSPQRDALRRALFQPLLTSDGCTAEGNLDAFCSMLSRSESAPELAVGRKAMKVPMLSPAVSMLLLHTDDVMYDALEHHGPLHSSNVVSSLGLTSQSSFDLRTLPAGRASIPSLASSPDKLLHLMCGASSVHEALPRVLRTRARSRSFHGALPSDLPFSYDSPEQSPALQGTSLAVAAKRPLTPDADATVAITQSVVRALFRRVQRRALSLPVLPDEMSWSKEGSSTSLAQCSGLPAAQDDGASGVLDYSAQLVRSVHDRKPSCCLDTIAGQEQDSGSVCSETMHSTASPMASSVSTPSFVDALEPSSSLPPSTPDSQLSREHSSVVNEPCHSDLETCASHVLSPQPRTWVCRTSLGTSASHRSVTTVATEPTPSCSDSVAVGSTPCFDQPTELLSNDAPVVHYSAFMTSPGPFGAEAHSSAFGAEAHSNAASDVSDSCELTIPWGGGRSAPLSSHWRICEEQPALGRLSAKAEPIRGGLALERLTSSIDEFGLDEVLPVHRFLDRIKTKSCGISCASGLKQSRDKGRSSSPFQHTGTDSLPPSDFTVDDVLTNNTTPSTFPEAVGSSASSSMPSTSSSGSLAYEADRLMALRNDLQLGNAPEALVANAEDTHRQRSRRRGLMSTWTEGLFARRAKSASKKAQAAEKTVVVPRHPEQRCDGHSSAALEPSVGSPVTVELGALRSAPYAPTTAMPVQRKGFKAAAKCRALAQRMYRRVTKLYSFKRSSD